MKFQRMLKYYFNHFIFLTFSFAFTNFELYAQWQTDVRITIDPGISNTSFVWCIAAIGDSVHIVWRDNRNGNLEIYYKRSSDAGISWGSDIRLTNNSAISEFPSVSVSGSVVHVVWQDTRVGTNYKVYYKRSTDAGISWGTDIQLTNNSTFSWFPCLSVSGSIVHVVWQDQRDGNSEIYYKRSTDEGVNWGADTRLTNNSAFSGASSISVSGQVVHVVWNDERDANDEIYYKRSTDGGVSWGADTRLTNNPAAASYPSVSASGSVVHVVWPDNRDGNYEIYYKRSTDEGVSWETDTRLTNNSAESTFPSISVSGQVVHIVWSDTRDGNYEIYYKRSSDQGISWGTDIRLTSFPGTSNLSSVSVSGSIVHVVWYDHRDGNDEIYYKRDPTGNIVGVININSEIPNEFKLNQNYPNPFNPVTKIKFSIPQTGKGQIVKIVIFNILGEEIATPVNQEFQPGTYEVEWNGTNYPSGVYYYKLIAGDFTETRKMVLIK